MSGSGTTPSIVADHVNHGDQLRRLLRHESESYHQLLAGPANAIHPDLQVRTAYPSHGLNPTQRHPGHHVARGPTPWQAGASSADTDIRPHSAPNRLPFNGGPEIVGRLLGLGRMLPLVRSRNSQRAIGKASHEVVYRLKVRPHLEA